MNTLRICTLLALLSFGGLAAIGQEAAAPARSVAIRFLPPPLDGTISLGIYNEKGKLVRVLQREAQVEDFNVGADALSTAWDGRDDGGQDLPAGRYSARGFAVAEMKVEETTRPAGQFVPGDEKTTLKLVANPLSRREREAVEVKPGFDEDGSFLQTVDGLPLFTVDECPHLIAASIVQRPDRSLEFSQTDGDTLDQFRIVGAQNMMAFDAGEFELK